MKQDAGSGGSAHVDELLDAFRSGELDDADRARVEEHLAACARCREELARAGAWSDAFDRAYAARRAAAAELEPDWAAQRAAIAARTSAGAPVRRPAFWRWAPQIALAAVAALIVGIVWRENPRREPASIATRASERASADSGMADGAPGLAERPEANLEDAPEANLEDARQAAEGEVRKADVPEPTPAAVARAREAPPAAPPPGEREEQFGEDRADDVAKAREEDAIAEAIPEAAVGAAQHAATLAPIERFRLEAREALAARDTTAARRALTLWSDTLAPRGDTLDQRRDRPGVLADSLRQLLGVPNRPDSLGALPGNAE